jgi:hypothetical protein
VTLAEIIAQELDLHCVKAMETKRIIRLHSGLFFLQMGDDISYACDYNSKIAKGEET